MKVQKYTPVQERPELLHMYAVVRVTAEETAEETRFPLVG